MLVARALKIGKIADGGMPPTYETMHWCIVSQVAGHVPPTQRRRTGLIASQQGSFGR
jgi:hypothetical protein